MPTQHYGVYVGQPSKLLVGSTASATAVAYAMPPRVASILLAGLRPGLCLLRLFAEPLFEFLGGIHQRLQHLSCLIGRNEQGARRPFLVVGTGRNAVDPQHTVVEGDRLDAVDKGYGVSSCIGQG